jgi:hypothetical protein
MSLPSSRRLLDQDAQEAGRAGVTGGRSSAMACSCCSVWPVPPGTRCSRAHGRRFHDEGAGRHVVAEALCTRSPCGSRRRTARAPGASSRACVPSVRRSARAANTRGMAGPRTSAAKPPKGSLARPACCRSSSSCLRVTGSRASACARGDRCGVDAGQDARRRRRVALRVRDLRRQGGQLAAASRSARRRAFQVSKVFAHAFPCPHASQRLRRL